MFAKVDAALHQNPKIQLAGPDAREVFVFLLCRNAYLDGGGKLPRRYIDAQYLSGQLSRSFETVRTGVDNAIEANLIHLDGDFVCITGWDEDWGKRPLTEAERKAKQRLAVRVRTVSGQSPDTNGTGPDSHVSEERREDKRTDSAARTRSRKKPATQIAPDWKPSEPLRQMAIGFGIDPDREAAAFVDYWVSEGAPKADWDATFRNRLRASAERRRNGHGIAPPAPPLRVIPSTPRSKSP